jgi:hypothetical protein
MDYPRHKVECRRIVANDGGGKNDRAGLTSTTIATSTSSSGPLVECRTIEGRGRSLFARTRISIGSHPLPLSTTKSAYDMLHPDAGVAYMERMKRLEGAMRDWHGIDDRLGMETSCKIM